MTDSRQRSAVWAIERVLWFLAVTLGASLVWWVPHPPMVDLPQHAGQVRLLHDLLLGESPWASRLRINLFTPYLIGYGLALPLSFVMSVTAAVKVVLTAAYLGYVAMCVRLGRHWNVDRRLDWLYVPAFFGFAFSWGFFTFLVASPIGLLLVWISERYARRATVGNALLVTLCGMALLASHGLMFLFCAGVGAAIVASLTPARLWLRRSVPFVALLFGFCAYFAASQQVEVGMNWTPDDPLVWEFNWMRLYHFLLYAVAPDGTHHALLAAGLVLVVAPWLIGARTSAARQVPIVVFCGMMAVLVLVPSFANRTAFLYERFALFFLPAYAWLFAEPDDAHRTPVRGSAAMLLLPLCVGFMLAWHVLQFRQFAAESAKIDAQMERLQPNQRVFSLIFDRDSAVSGLATSYLHYPAWYQAEQGGFVEFNFAWFPPQIVRFRADHASHVKPPFDWFPGTFDWARDGGDDATYFFVRRTDALPEAFFAAAPCRPTVDWQSGEWTIYKRVPTCR